LYASTKVAEEEEKEEKEDPAAKKAARLASTRTASSRTNLRPQPRKPAVGAQSVGQVRTAGASEMSELSNLWHSAPDVTDVFRS
jgi:hypothetical protein